MAGYGLIAATESLGSTDRNGSTPARHCLNQSWLVFEDIRSGSEFHRSYTDLSVI